MTDLRKIPDWERHYRDEDVVKMPWYYPDLDPDVAKALAGHEIEGGGLDALDLGTGPGTQAIALAKMGFNMTATDISEAAVGKARRRAVEAGVEIEFVQDDILHSSLEKRFDLVLDRGVFHVFPDEQRPDYLANVACLSRPGGWFFLKCFSEAEARDEGPYRFSPERIREYFDAAFAIFSIEETVYHGTLDPLPKALFCVMRRN